MTGAVLCTSAVDNTEVRQCQGENCRPPGPAPSPVPSFHSHWGNSGTGQVSRGFWGPIDGPAAANALRAVAAPTSGRRKRQRLGQRGEAAATGAEPAMERVSAPEASSAAGGSTTTAPAGSATTAMAGPPQRAEGREEGETQPPPRAKAQDSSRTGGVPVVGSSAPAGAAPAADEEGKGRGASGGGGSAAGGAACGECHQTETWRGRHDCHCSICGNKGILVGGTTLSVARVYGRPEDLISCDGCPRAFHRRCLPAGTDSQLAATFRARVDAWFCSHCTKMGRTSLVYQQNPDWTVVATVRARGDGAPLFLEDVISTSHPLFDIIKAWALHGDKEVLSKYRALEKNNPAVLQTRLNNEAEAAGRAAAGRAQAEMMRRPCEGATSANAGDWMPVNATPARDLQTSKPVVPVCELLLAAYQSTGLDGETAGNGQLTFQQLFGKISPNRLRTGASAVEGCGVFAADIIQPMDVLAEFTGERITRTVAQQRVVAYRKMDFHVSSLRQGCVVQLAGDCYLDSVTVGPLAEGCSPRLFNHSCQANTYLHTVAVGQGQSQEKRVFVCSLKSIEAGQELFLSYPAPGTVGLGPA
ncbi:conserved unknown protein [Ectocarpus siliculosus]|uniref:SET domain-containing protein n=1 Tax=Ectocarpus siliculosus TaxID=2880 RepID=D7FS21_ECTSI|nr:conserved unknown protein [Ectocarpus siliculosus]|eukprot:CBJ30962.1 conserved unknown protein [Ectocarpus siliculosus]